MKKAAAMLERRSLAIEPARAAWRDWLAAAQRMRQLTRDGAGACEGLIESLQRWPSFAAADPWAINAQMPARPDTADGQSPTKRSCSFRDALPPPGAARAAPSRPVARAAQSPVRSSTLAPRATAVRAVLGLTTRASAAKAHAEALAIGVDMHMSHAAVDAMPTAASVIAALVAETMARHAPDAPTGGPAASSSSWSERLPDSTKPAAKATATSRSAPPGESRPALQAVDLPVRAAFERIAHAEAPPPAAALLAPAAELLQRLLPREPSPTPGDNAPTSRIAAPRAPSRLLTDPGRSTSTPDIGPRSAVPNSALPDMNDEISAETSAEAISRQLADQAWLRGVDFT
jgi:hypothetical protein